MGESSFEEVGRVRNLILEGEYPRARRELQAILERDPRFAQAWVFLGEVLERSGVQYGAWLCYRRGWLLDPSADWVGPVSARLGSVAQDDVEPWLADLLKVPDVSVAAAIIVKDEADGIRRCVESLDGAVDEVVVVDTGSSDDTVNVLRQLGCDFYTFSWTGSFAEARNFALEHVKSDWVLWIDADEWLEPADVDAPHTVAGLYGSLDRALTLRIVQVNDVGGRLEPNFDMSRMHPNRFGFHWEGRIHEQLVAAPEYSDGEGRIPRLAVNVRLKHTGYQPDVMLAKGKLERNIGLLRAAVQDNPEDVGAWGFLGRELLFAGRTQDAITALYRAETLSREFSWYARGSEVRVLLVEALLKEERIEEARAVANRGVAVNPEFPGIWYAKGRVDLVAMTKLLASARQAFDRAQSTSVTYRGMVSFDSLIPRWRAKAGAADTARFSGDLVTAKRIYEELLKTEPGLSAVRTQVERINQQARALCAGLGADDELSTPTDDGQGGS